MCFAVSVSSSPWVTPLQCCSVSPATSFYILLQPLPSLPFEFQPVQGLVWGSDLFSSPKRRRRREEIVILFFLAWNERSILHLGNAVPFSCCEAEGLCSLWSSCHLCMSVCLAQCSLCWSLNLSFVSRKKKKKILSESVFLLQLYLLLIHLIPLSLWSMKSEGQGSQHMLLGTKYYYLIW